MRISRMRIDETREWARCGKCGNRLFKIDKDNGLIRLTGIEIKCHSCKSINSFNDVQKKGVE